MKGVDYDPIIFHVSCICGLSKDSGLNPISRGVFEKKTLEGFDVLGGGILKVLGGTCRNFLLRVFERYREQVRFHALDAGGVDAAGSGGWRGYRCWIRHGLLALRGESL